MLGVVAIGLLAAMAAGAMYLGRESLGLAGAGMALLRTLGVVALAVLLINPAWSGPSASAPPTVLLDASLSLAASGGRWREALDTARALAGARGTVWRFGSRVAPADTSPPTDGATRLAEALRLAHGRPGPVIVVTDGEVEDAASLEPTLLAESRVVVLPRRPVPDAALVDLAVPPYLGSADSLPLGLVIGTFGDLAARRATVEVSLDGRPVARRAVELPPPPGHGQRRLVVGPRSWPPGLHLVSARLLAPGDSEPRDDRRDRWIRVAAAPQLVVLAAPADWEARFLVRELFELAPGAVRAYALIQTDRWVDMRTLAPVPRRDITAAVARARVLVLRGADWPVHPGTAVWHWLTGDSSASLLAGDWYVGGALPASPLAGRLAQVRWDSLAPLVGLVPVAGGVAKWIALSARMGRRGAERPVLVGWDSGGTRHLAVAGEGFWRWALRGGAAREAYRTLLASGLDWLLRTEAAVGSAVLQASEVASQGTPVVFRFLGDTVPDSLRVLFEAGREERPVTLSFGGERTARVWLPPGIYRWRVVGGGRPASGQVVVEEYSDEFVPRAIALPARAGGREGGAALRSARQEAWLFAVVIVALAGEWIWRRKRGLA